MATFQYSTLGQDEFRLLKVDHENSPTKYSLQAFPQVNCPPYTALSYVWGSSAPSARLACDNGEIPITPELQAILHRIAETPSLIEPPWIWVDAICINQADVQEKAVQIPKMGEIYNSASTVTVWIGDADKATTEALRGIEDHHFLIALTGTVPVPGIIPDADDPMWKAVEEFFSRPWFGRAWVAQEVLLAKKCRIVFGEDVIPWQVVLRYWAYMEMGRQDFVVSQRHRIGHDTMSPFGMLLTAGSAKGGERWSKVISHDKLEWVFRSRYHVVGLLDLIRRRACKEGHDKAYSLLGLFPEDIRSKIPIRYDAPYEEAYISLAKVLLKKPGFHVLALAPSVSRVQGLPSWCPNLNSLGTMMPHWHHFTAGSVKDDSFPTPHFEIDSSNALRVPGVFVDTIKAINPLPNLGPLIDNEEKAREMLQFLKSHCKDLDGLHTLVGGVDRNGTEYKMSDLRDDLEETKDYLQIYIDGSRVWGANTPLTAALLQAWRGATRFTTENGHLGLGPDTLRQGDRVAIFFTASCPFVVRETSSVGDFELIGPAYVHKYRDGRFFQALNPSETKVTIRII